MTVVNKNNEAKNKPKWNKLTQNLTCRYSQRIWIPGTETFLCILLAFSQKSMRLSWLGTPLLLNFTAAVLLLTTFHWLCVPNYKTWRLHATDSFLSIFPHLSTKKTCILPRERRERSSVLFQWTFHWNNCSAQTWQHNIMYAFKIKKLPSQQTHVLNANYLYMNLTKEKQFVSSKCLHLLKHPPCTSFLKIIPITPLSYFVSLSHPLVLSSLFLFLLSAWPNICVARLRLSTVTQPINKLPYML